MGKQVLIYDTTLRDGTQGENINFSAEDKVRIAKKLDNLGFHYIEGGWPGSNPRDVRFFKLARKIDFINSRIAAFGSTRKPHSSTESNANIKALLKTETQTVTIFGKSWDLHVLKVLGTTLDENLSMIADTVSYIKSKGRETIYDAEHFFDGYKNRPDYALKTVQAAVDAGADMVVLCDTNGGSLSGEIFEIVGKVRRLLSVPLGIHAHNDCALAVANTLSGVDAGAVLVQGTVNGYGERCGNADLVSVIPNLMVKMGKECIPRNKLQQITDLSRYVSEVANLPPLNQRPFVGNSAFAHKGGVHVSAIMKEPSAYEHMDPEIVGNHRRVLVSDLAGKSNVAYKIKEMDIPLDPDSEEVQEIVQEVKRLEDSGYQYDAAEGSFELLVKKISGRFVEPFSLKTLRVAMEKNENGPPVCQATIKISVGGVEEITAAEGDGPVNAMDNAIRKALIKFYPQLQEMKLVDFKVRVIEGSKGTAAKVRVLIESRDKKSIWGTVGVSANIIEASWQALVESLQYKLSLVQNGK